MSLTLEEVGSLWHNLPGDELLILDEVSMADGQAGEQHQNGRELHPDGSLSTNFESIPRSYLEDLNK